jgi:hypothetical protein
MAANSNVAIKQSTSDVVFMVILQKVSSGRSISGLMPSIHRANSTQKCGMCLSLNYNTFAKIVPS